MKHQTVIMLLVGITILGILVIFIGPVKIIDALKYANPWYVALAVVIQFVVFGMYTQRWSITVRALHISISRKHLFPMLMVGLAVNNLTPSGRGGGEPVRAYMLGKYTKAPMEEAFATVIADRGLDTFPFVVLAILTLIFTIFYLTLPRWIVLPLAVSLVALIVAFIILLYMSINEPAGVKITLWVVRVIKRFSKRKHFEIETKAIEALKGFQASIRVMLKNRNVLAIGLPLSFLVWFVEILRVYTVFAAFGTRVPLVIIAAVFVIASIVGLIPIIPGGVGAVDGIMIILFTAAGVPPSISAAATIVERLISFWMTSFIGMGMLPIVGAGVMEKFSDIFNL